MSPRPPESAESLSRRDGLVLAGIALAIRILLLATTAGDPVFQIPMLDAEYLVGWARQVAAGDFFASPEGTAYFRTPLYAWFLAGAFRLPGDDLVTARILQAVLGTVTTVLVASIAARRFGRIAAWATGLLAALAWPLLHYGRELLISSVVVFLVAALLVVWDRATPRSANGRWLAIGALVAACALAWGSLAIVLFPALALAALEEAPSARVRVQRAALVVLGFALLVAPIAIRNKSASGDWVLLASQGGINLWIGNNPEADGMSARLPGFSSWRNEDVDAALAREHGRRLRPAEQDRVFRAKAFDFMRTQPVDAARLLAKKVYLFAQGYEIRNDRDLDSLRERSAILNLPLPDFGWVGPLALAGIVFTRRRWRELTPLLATAVSIAFAVVLFFVCARYRMAVWPALLPFAGAAVAALAERGLSPAGRAARVALVAGLVVLARVDFLHIRNPDPSQPHFQYGNVFARAGDFGEAEREFREALAIAPEFGEAHHHLGALLLEQRRYDEALPELREGARLLPESFRAKRSLAEALEATGRMEEAFRLRQEIAEQSAGDPEDVHALARTLGAAGRYREAWALFEQTLADAQSARRPEDPWLLLNAGQTALAVGEEEQGLALLKRAEAFDAVRESALEARALYYIATRRHDVALGILSDALLDAPDNARLIRLRAAARYSKGDATGAIEDLQRLLQLDPNDEDAKRRLAEIEGRTGTSGGTTP